MRIGVFVCLCGSNIAATVDVDRVAEIAKGFPDVVFAKSEMYACSEPGQMAIRDAITNMGLEGVVVASCSPRMHEVTFRRAVERAGINRYMFEMANIREHVSWISKGVEQNTRKAADLVRAAVEKLRLNKGLTATTFEVNKRALVVGGGVAGIQAALDLADSGLQVVLVEREPSIGGKMAKLDKTFPTVDCSACILGPKMVDVAQHQNITLHTYSEIEEVSGYVGSFEVKVRKKTPYVHWDACTGCGLCMEKCPSSKSPDLFNEQLKTTTAISIPFPQAIPKKARIDPLVCLKLTKDKCGACAKICPTGAVDFGLVDEIVTESVGAVILATGYDLFDHTKYPEYGGGKYPDVITSMQYERLLNASGPTSGHVLRPSDGKEPKRVVFVQCVGSRDASVGRPYCSGFCCMATAKQAILTKDHIPDAEVFVFYIDVRAPGKLYEEFYTRAREEYGVRYVRGRVSKLWEVDGVITVQGADTLLQAQVEVDADLVVLAVGGEPSTGARALAEKLRISYDAHGFFMESHPKLRPVETNTAGIFLAGACQGLKDIPSSVAQGSAAAAKAMVLLSRDRLEANPQVAGVNQARCIGCGKCAGVCPFQAIEMTEDRWGATKAKVIESLCQGCGVCNVACLDKAIQLDHFTDDQILAGVKALCREWKEKN
ncbi:MAG: CoB--CoM heterodisulfide reductase iron-sulfur subunit A family protein [Proteobacteria bacterium]|nr:CoB--CoM heterodisulfide reductase iron-sulfur subunit A family protein [Pseudomonadota bacterium]